MRGIGVLADLRECAGRAVEHGQERDSPGGLRRGEKVRPIMVDRHLAVREGVRELDRQRASPAQLAEVIGLHASPRAWTRISKSGPEEPFRTDSWPLHDPDAEIVVVHKPKKPEGYEAADWQRPKMRHGSSPTAPTR